MPFWVGFEAFAFLGFSALGLRTSLLDFFWLLAITVLLPGQGARSGLGPAVEVCRTIIGDHRQSRGISRSLLEPVGYGFDRPLPELSASEAPNRRVEVVIANAAMP
jgi:hypothetical protein